MSKKEIGIARRGVDPFALLRQMASEFDRGAWPFRWTGFGARPLFEEGNWAPRIDVFEKDNRLITKVDLPGVKTEDVKVEIVDGQLAISGERKSEVEEKKENFFACERAFGGFYRTVPLPEGVKAEDVKATFAEGVLEVSVPLAAKAAAAPQKIEVKAA